MYLTAFPHAETPSQHEECNMKQCYWTQSQLQLILHSPPKHDLSVHDTSRNRHLIVSSFRGAPAAWHSTSAERQSSKHMLPPCFMEGETDLHLEAATSLSSSLGHTLPILI